MARGVYLLFFGLFDRFISPKKVVKSNCNAITALPRGPFPYNHTCGESLPAASLPIKRNQILDGDVAPR